MPPPDRKLERLTGTAARELVRPGSAGEHDAVVLRLRGGKQVILQRRGANPFSDAKTRQLAGHKVRVKGYLVGDIFRYVEAELLDS